RYSAHLNAFDFSPEGNRMRRYETTCNRYVDRYFKELLRRMNGDAANHPMRTSTDYLRSRTPVLRQPIRDNGSPKNAEVSAWFKKGSGTVVQSTLGAVPATVPDPFLNHAEVSDLIGPVRMREGGRTTKTSDAKASVIAVAERGPIPRIE